MWFDRVWRPISNQIRRLSAWWRRPKSQSSRPDLFVRDIERLTRDIDSAMSDMRFMVRPHAGLNVLLPTRLNLLRIDPGYLEVADSATFKVLGAACERCPSWRKCARDLARGDATTGLKSYCLNAEVIDTLIVGRFGVWTDAVV